MPISFFIGPPRTGKTYEAVMTMVLPAVEQGRRVVTNIPLQPEGIKEYFRSRRSGPLGRLLERLRLRRALRPLEIEPDFVIASTRQLRDPESYPWDPEGEFIPGSLVQPGDMVVIDEAHVTFPASEKLDHRISSFFRVHGHFFDDRLGKSIDIVVITQDASTLKTDFKYLGETYMKVSPVRSKIGGKLGAYKASYYPSASMTASDMIGKPALRKISADIVKCYKSFTHGSGGKTQKMDGRASHITLGMRLYLGFGALCMGWGIYNYTDPFNSRSENAYSSSSPSGSSLVSRASQPVGGRCYGAGIFIDGAWHTLSQAGELVREAVAPRDGCKASGPGSPFDLGGYGI